jgi:hypothetical protein
MQAIRRPARILVKTGIGDNLIIGATDIGHTDIERTASAPGNIGDFAAIGRNGRGLVLPANIGYPTDMGEVSIAKELVKRLFILPLRLVR